MPHVKLKTARPHYGLLLLLLLTCPAAASAQTVINLDGFEASVPGNSRITYLDLVRKVFPDAREKEDGGGLQAGKSVAISHLFGDYKERLIEGVMSIDGASALRIKNGGGHQLLLLIEVSSRDDALFQWGGMSVLALFSTAGEAKLLDAVDVRADRFTFFAEQQPLLRIHPERDAVLVVNHHFNSGDGYLAYSLIAFVDNRLKDVFEEMPLLVGDNHCGTNFTETPRFKVLNNPAGGYSRLRLTITLRKEAGGPTCERPTKGYTRYFNYLLAWQPSRKRYVAGADATGRLRRADKALGFEF
jgi:hypothetical protein